MSDADTKRVPIVGIGASAGGIEALEQLFRAVPRASGTAYVIVTHLSPSRESLLPTIVQRWTEMPVGSIEDDISPQADHVYVMPENATLTIADGRFQLVRPRSVLRDHKPIDLFLSSLALDLGERAVAVILSGSDGDGTLGAKAVKEHGGLTLAQIADGTAPKYPGMPDTAIASGMIDFAVPVQDMPGHIASFIEALGAIEQLESDEGEAARFEQFRGEIYALLQGQIGHDFSGYKTKTFNRRVQRRKQLLQIETLEDYVTRLRRDSTEVAALFRDLLINVTNFFRDKDAFDALQTQVIPALFEGKGRADTVRVWVPGCATGEEVYSIAILMREHMDTLDVRPRVQVFATDIDERSLEAARGGRYPEPLLDAVTPERRRRFFVEDGTSFIVSKDVRELCVFSPHSLIRDPPFSRMDLVSCRNLLIYLAPNLQGSVIPLFHYSLRPNGFLFLGTSENVGQFSDLFAPVDKKQRIFKARENVGGSMRVPIMVRGTTASLLSESGRAQKLSSVQSLRQDVESRVLDRYAPAYVVVNAESDVVLYSGRTGKYLEPAAGVPSRQLLAMARKGIRLELRSAMRDAVSEQCRVERHGLTVESEDGHLQPLSLIIEPMDAETEEPLFIVVFADSGPLLDREQASTRMLRSSEPGDALTAVERELGETRDRLQSMVEEYETALEELKSSNEELVSVNEELQSTNEELEASKEELQSLNEELQTVNAELGHKIDELDDANGDLRNLFNTSKIASIVVDDDFSIRSFTPLAAPIFNLLPADRGRSLATFSGSLAYPDFIGDLTSVLTNGHAIESRVPGADGSTRYLVRIQRYEAGVGSQAGATVTLVDITSLGVS